jgi:hypothetical protein
MVIDRSYVGLGAPANLLAGGAGKSFLRKHLTGHFEQVPSRVSVLSLLFSFHACSEH